MKCLGEETSRQAATWSPVTQLTMPSRPWARASTSVGHYSLVRNACTLLILQSRGLRLRERNRVTECQPGLDSKALVLNQATS